MNMNKKTKSIATLSAVVTSLGTALGVVPTALNAAQLDPGTHAPAQFQRIAVGAQPGIVQHKVNPDAVQFKVEAQQFKLRPEVMQNKGFPEAIQFKERPDAIQIKRLPDANQLKIQQQ
jgi:hypothetical protein